MANENPFNSKFTNRRIQSPCYNCEKRCAGCHSVCEKYAEYQKRTERFGEQRRNAMKINNEMCDYIFNRMKKR